MRYQHLKIVRKLSKYIVPTAPLLFVVLIVLFNPPVPSFITSIGHLVSKPFWVLDDTIGNYFHNITQRFGNKEQVIQENETLHEYVSQLQRKIFYLETFLSEQESIKALYTKANKDAGYLPAAVLHVDRFISRDMFVIDLGTESGVRNNMLIVTPENIAIGFIQNVFPNTSLVQLFSAPQTNVQVVISATTSVHASLVGQGNGSMYISLPRDVDVQVGNAILLPSFSTYPIGTIVEVEVTPEDAFKIAYIQSPVNILTQRHVLVDTTTLWGVDSESLTNTIEAARQYDEDES